MNKKVYFFSLIIICVISLATLVVSIINRHDVERTSEQVEFVLDYDEIAELANESEEDIIYWMRFFETLGVTSVGVMEETVFSLAENKELHYITYKELEEESFWRENDVYERVQSLDLDKFDIILGMEDNELYKWINDSYKNRYADIYIDAFKVNNHYYIVLDGNEKEALYLQDDLYLKEEREKEDEIERLYASKIINLGIGLDKNKVNQIKQSGLEVIPRIISIPNESLKSVEAYKREIKRHDINPNVLILTGKEVLGFPDNMNLLADYLREKDISISLIETEAQRMHINFEGLDGLISLMEQEQLVRVFSVWDWVQERYKYYNYQGAEEITNTFYRAITERNIRMIYFKPFVYNDNYVTDEEAYEDMFADLEQRLEDHSITIGKHTPFKSLDSNYYVMILIALGIIISGLILINIFYRFSEIINLSLFVVSVLGVAGALFVAPNFTTTIISLAIAIIFPSLSLYYLFARLRNINIKLYKKELTEKSLFKIIIESINIVIITNVISLLGGLFLSGVLADIRYILELKIYRGVKVSQIIPLIILGLLIIRLEMNMNIINSLTCVLKHYIKLFNKLLNVNLKLKHILITGFIFVIGYVYLARTGHETNIQPSTLEITLRNFLENALMVRPRLKEFLIATPIIIVSVYLVYKLRFRFIIVLVFIAMVGQTSIINTFSHQRTPIYVSVIRTIFGTIIGLIIGIAFIVGLFLLEKIIAKMMKLYKRGLKEE
ncbi:MAG: DUF5693 family protein [Eubacteriales bacterium]